MGPTRAPRATGRTGRSLVAIVAAGLCCLGLASCAAGHSASSSTAASSTTSSTTAPTTTVPPTTSTSSTSTTSSTTTSTTVAPTTTTQPPVINTSCPTPSADAQFYAPGAGKTVALTFDDGPGATTGEVLQILEEYKVPATFFNIGENEVERPQYVQEEAKAGFLLGNHTWDHPDMVTLSAAAEGAELDETSRETMSLTGLPTCVFRPPYGDYNAQLILLANERRMTVWLWSVDTEDWEADGSGSTYWVDRIISLAESEGGALDNPVVIMHNQPAGNPATVEALPTIIEFFRSHGYRFVNLLGQSTPPGPL